MNLRSMLVNVLAVAAVLAGWQAARAGTVVLTFEGLKDLEPIANFYNGGLGGLGSGPSDNYGITFDPDSLASISRDSGGTGNFSGNPSGNTTAFFLTGTGDLMNVAAGFDTGFSFYYSAANNPGSITVYTGLEGTGSILAQLDLPVTPALGGGTGPFNNWQPIGVAFSGTAESVNFSGSANQIGFDNITLGADVPAVPLPAAAWMGMSLLGGLLAGKIKRKTAQ